MRLKRFAVPLVSVMALTVATASHAQTAPEPAQADEAESEVVVTGIRRSIADSIAQKRNSTVIQDSITAEDIGKLPDQNVAETLNRIPGVQITRVEGQGSAVTVRGIGLNRLLLNGQAFAGSDRNGSPNLADVSPELLAGIDVIKAPSADLIEGWLGAIINLKTKRPLDFKKPVFSARAQASYADLAEKFGKKGSAFYTHSFMDGKLGFLINGSFDQMRGAGDLYASGGWTQVSGVDITGDGTNDTFYRPLRLQQARNSYNDKRWALNGTIQFKPTDNLVLTLDGFRSHRTSDRVRSYQQLVLTNTITGGQISDGTLTTGNISGVTLRPLLYAGDGESDNSAIAFNAAYKADRWTVDFSASKSDGDSSGLNGNGGVDGPGNDNVLVARQIAGNTVAVGYRGGTSAISPDYSIATNFNRYDASQFEFFTNFDQDYINRNSGRDVALNARYEIDAGILKAIKVGARYEKLGVFSGNAVAVYPAGNAITIAPLADPTPGNSLRANEVPGINYGPLISLFEGRSGGFPGIILGGTADAATFRRALGVIAPSFDPVSAKGTINEVDQRTTAGYAKLEYGGDLGGATFSGDLGVRVVDVKRHVNGFTLASSTSAVPVSVDRKFRSVLPNFNLIVQPTDQLVLRFAAAEVTARPELSSTGVGVSLQPVSMTGTAGNPDLKPYAATQFDLTAEWYFARASMISLSLFKKNVSAFTRIVQFTELHPEAPNNTMTGPAAITYLVSRPENGTDGKIDGFEVSYQHALTFLPAPFDGLGFSLAYTYAKSTTPNVDALTGKTLPIPNASKNSLSAVGYYEKGPFSGRVAYSYRSSYLVQQQAASAGGSLYAAGRGQLDASASLKLSEQVRLTVEGVNLTRDINSFYVNDATRLFSAYQNDRRVYFGAAVTF